MCKYLMMDYKSEHFEFLHKLGYLPIKIQSLPEGIFTKPNIPHMAGINTVDHYAWLGLFLETLFSKLSWQLPTVATIANKFKENAVEWTLKTDSENLWFTDYMCHDFHSRGGNPFTSITAGLGHAFSNKGSDTLNVIPASRYYYDFDENEVPINSVNASEHSVTCTGIFYYEVQLKKLRAENNYEAKLQSGKLDNYITEYYNHPAPCDGDMLNPDYKAIAEWLNLRDWLKKFPKGILSVVSDTFDLWKLITFILPRLRKEITSKEGKLVVRPDSGNPVDIICGRKLINVEDIEDKFNDDEDNSYYNTDDNYYAVKEDRFYEFTITEYPEGGFRNYILGKEVSINQVKGVVQLLDEIFGSTENKQGFKVLDPHIGAIYGDSINLERQVQIYSRLAEKGFAATNVVLGIGSFSYVYMTRDQAGWAAKGAWFETLEKTENVCGCGEGFQRDCKYIESVDSCDHVYQRVAYDIYKDPVTDDGTKKSLRGFQFAFYDKEGEIQVESGVSEEKAFSEENLLKVIYADGVFYNQTTLEKIRERLNNK